MPEAVRTTTSLSGAASRRRGSAPSPSRPGIERSSRTRSGRSRPASTIASSPSDAGADDIEAVRAEQRGERLAGQRMVVDDEDPRRPLLPLSAATASADKREVRGRAADDYQNWLWGEMLLAGLLGASLALFLSYPVLRTPTTCRSSGIVLQTTMSLAGLLVAVLQAPATRPKGAGSTCSLRAASS